MDNKTKADETQVAVVNNSIEALIAKAIDNKVDVATMERLLTMRRELKAEWAKAQFDKALAAFQADCPTIKRTKAVYTDSEQLAYKFAPLESIVEQVKKLLQEHGFSYAIQTETRDTRVKAICIAKHTDGHSEPSSFEVPLGNKTKIMSQTQVVAAALTFAKRYAFCNAFGILTGDEDTDAKDEIENPKCETQSANGNRLITARQRGYLKGLLKRKGYSESDVAIKYKVANLAELTSRQASQIIENLQKLPDREEEAIDVNEVAAGIERNRIHAS